MKNVVDRDVAEEAICKGSNSYSNCNVAIRTKNIDALVLDDKIKDLFSSAIKHAFRIITSSWFSL